MVGGRHVAGVPRLTLALLAAPREQVALEDVRKLKLAGSGALEPLLRAGMGLDLGHGLSGNGRLVLMPQPRGKDKRFREDFACGASYAFATSSAVSSSSSSSTS